MMDEAFVRPVAPLRSAWGKRGERVQVPLLTRSPCRTAFCAMNVESGDAVLMSANRWRQFEYQDFLRLIRWKWRGWNIVLFLDRGTPHTAEESLLVAQDLDIELRWLPVACPQLNPVENLWGAMKGRQCLANWPEPLSADQAIDIGLSWLASLKPRQILEKSGALSPNFWLRNLILKRKKLL